ncbi:hypothetical protein Q5Y75_24815, partial [Ruegeria sp. 2205SS24-7]|uniref:hypothetical protein n=1 Tax=Ruegeria discodermiae TaxID=3064389 RepID=UPI002741271F
ADILQERGKLDEALKIREEEELPVYEEIGELRVAARTFLQIADLKEKLEDPSSALEDLRRASEIIPAEHVKDSAIFQSRIADILEGQGQLAEALKIREEEELPVYEALGDDWALLVALDRAADLSQRLGRLAQASTLRNGIERNGVDQFGELWAALLKGKQAWLELLKGHVEGVQRTFVEIELPAYEKAEKTAWIALTQAKIAWVEVRLGETAEAALQRATAALTQVEEMSAADQESVTKAHLYFAEMELLAGRHDDVIARVKHEILPRLAVKPNLGNRLIAEALLAIAHLHNGNSCDFSSVLEDLVRAQSTGDTLPTAWWNLAAALSCIDKDARATYLEAAEAGFSVQGRPGWVARFQD